MNIYKLIANLVLAAVIQALAMTAAQSAEIQNKKVTVNGAEINYVEVGKGPLMILIHGALTDHTVFLEQMKALSKDFRVVSYPQRYYGKDDWGNVPADISYQDLAAKDAADVIKALDAGPAHLVGWSMGGQIAHAAALNHPEQVKSAYLFEGTAPLSVEDERSKTDMKVLGPTFGAMAAAAKANDGTTLTKLVWEDLAVETPYDKVPVDQKKYYETFALAFSKVLLSHPQSQRSCKEISSSSVPTALVRGDATTKLLQQLYFDGRWDPCIDVITIKGANHMWPVADPSAFVESVSVFARKH